MASTIDSEKLLNAGQDENIDGETDKDLKSGSGEQTEEESKSPRVSSEEEAETDSEKESETKSETEPDKQPEEKSEQEPGKEPEEKSEQESGKESEEKSEQESGKEPEEKSEQESGKEPEEESEEETEEGSEQETVEEPEKASGKVSGETGPIRIKNSDLPHTRAEDEQRENTAPINTEVINFSAAAEDYADDEDPDDDESDEGGMGLNLFTLFVLLFAAAITAIYFTCTVRTVHVKGNSLYTSEEIAEQVIRDDSQLMHNTVFLTALYMTPKAPKIPFEESVRVSLNSYDTITITVKDMDIAGFIPYAGKNLYFSADGIVLENSPLTVKDATFVTGISVTGAQIGTKMTSDDEVGLGMILEVLQILRKFEIKTDCVVLTDSGSIVMYMGEIKVILGRSDFELKISKIAQIMPYLEGRSGTINMTNYTSSDQIIILK